MVFRLQTKHYKTKEHSFPQRADIYYKLDKKTREELISTVKRVAIEILEGPKETWITADEVTKMWPFFSKEWMKRYGYLLSYCNDGAKI